MLTYNTNSNTGPVCGGRSRDEIIQEEARKLYVAMTRTKKKLIITHHSHFSAKGRDFAKSRSRFIQPVMSHFN